MNIRASIEDTRKGFEESFASEDFYNRQTQDAEHLGIIFQLKHTKQRLIKCDEKEKSNLFMLWLQNP